MKRNMFLAFFLLLCLAFSLLLVACGTDSDSNGKGSKTESDGPVSDTLSTDSPEIVTILFNLSGGQLSYGSLTISVEIGSTISIVDTPDVYRDGCLFAGWAYDSEGNYMWSIDDVFASTTELFAIWELDSVGDANGGTTDTSIGTTDTSIGTTDTSSGTTDTSIGTTDTSIGTTDTSIGTTDTSNGATDTSIGTTDSSVQSPDDPQPPHNHEYVERVIVTEATCTDKGEWRKYCVCGEFEKYEIPTKSHTEQTVYGKASTCKETGLTDGKKCSACGKIIVEQEIIPTKSHTEQTVYGKASTCKETGLTDGKKCSACGEIIVEQEIIPTKSHTEQTVYGKASTCKETGLTDGKKCSACGEIIVEQEIIPVSGCDYVDGFCLICQKEYGSEGLSYTLSSDGTYYTVTGGNCTDVDVVIPSTYEGKPVTCIGSYAFYMYDADLRSVTMPNSITSIESYAFYWCYELESINLSSNLTDIGNYAFHSCELISSITFPDSLTKIGTSAFWGCDGLSNVVIPNGTIGQSAFNSCKGLLYVTVGDGVTSLGELAFSNCSKLETVTIPDSVTSVGRCAFDKCKKATVYCEVYNRPSGWNSAWNATFDMYNIMNVTYCSVVWGFDFDATVFISGLGEVPVVEMLNVSAFEAESEKMFGRPFTEEEHRIIVEYLETIMKELK